MIHKKKMMHDMWKDYSDAVIHKNAPEAQIAEVKLAFYAGAWSYICCVYSLDPGDEPTVSDLHYMNTVADEIQTYLTERAKLPSIKPINN